MHHLAVRVALAVLLFAATAAAAQESPVAKLADLSLEELLNIRIVTVTRRTETTGTAPGRVEVVTAGQIARRGYRSLADLLRDVPGVKMDFSIDQDVSGDVTFQGTRGGSRLVILLDGIRISSPTNEALPILANFPVHSARQVEIVYGPASALYGADAMSGVINIISRDADEAEGLRAATLVGQGGLSNTQASYGVKLGSRAQLTVSGQWLYDGGFDLSAAYPADFGGLVSHRTGIFDTIFGPMTSAVPISAEYDVPLRARSFHAAVGAGALTAWVFGSYARTSNTPAYTPDNAVYNALAFAQNEMLVGTVSYQANVGRVGTTSSFMASRHELDPKSGYLNVYSNMQRSYKYAFGSMVRGEHQAAWNVGNDLSLTAGGAVERLFAQPQSADLNDPVTRRDVPGTILGTNIPDEGFQLRYTNVGAYVQGQWSRSPRLALTAGGRIDYNSRYDTVFNPRLGLVSRVTPRTTAKLMFGTAYIAPSPYQSFSHYGSFYSVDGGQTYQSDFWHVPNPDLNPQHKRTVEAQVQQRLGSNLQLTASGFRSWFTDLVLESDVTAHESGTYLGWPVAYILRSINGGREEMYGGTLSVDFMKTFSEDRKVAIRGAYSFVDGRTDLAGAPGGRMQSGGFSPQLFQLVSDIDWSAWTFSPRVITVGEQRALAPAVLADGRWVRHTIPGYTTVDITARRQRLLGPITVFASAENLLDARYRHLNLRAFTNPEEMRGSPQNPRRISVGVEVELR